MSSYSNNRLLTQKVNELKRIENMLQPYPDIDDLNKMTLGHVMLKEEQRKLRESVERDAFSSGMANPLAHDPFFQTIKKQPLRAINNNVTNNDMHSPNNQYSSPLSFSNPTIGFAGEPLTQTSTETDQVSPEERQKACDALISNGCGARGNFWTPMIPNNPYGFDFAQACNNHDQNYTKLNFGFKRANDIFLQDMLSVPNKIIRIRGGSVVMTSEETAKFYHSFVTGQNGLDAYNIAQKNAHICKYGRKPNRWK